MKIRNEEVEIELIATRFKEMLGSVRLMERVGVDDTSAEQWEVLVFSVGTWDFLFYEKYRTKHAALKEVRRLEKHYGIRNYEPLIIAEIDAEDDVEAEG